ncbi:hypothetical protein KEM52_000704, partial [Ascosphaera acerosa]
QQQQQQQRPPIPLTSPFSGTPIVGASGGIVPPGNTGLRGVLDNIVSDGMRMAAEVKKRMDEAQRELERNARARGGDGSGRGSGAADDDEDDDEDEYYDGPTADGGDAAGRRDRGSGASLLAATRQADLDLLEGAEIEGLREKEARPSGEVTAVAATTPASSHGQEQDLLQPSQSDSTATRRSSVHDGSSIRSVDKIVEFDS